MRPHALRAISWVVILFPLIGGSGIDAAEPPSAATVVWPGDVRSPAVCVGKTGWYASVVPVDVPIDSITGAFLVRAGANSVGRVLHLDPEERLCLLEAEEPLEGTAPVEIPEKTSLNPGQRAGCLSGSSSCRTTVAGKEWAYRGENFHLPLLRMRLSQSGLDCSAGTPLVDDEGGLVGLLTGRGTSTQDEVFAIPASRVRKVVEDLKRHRRSGRIWIGLIFHDDSSAPEVVEVKEGSPAEKAEFRTGDVILSLNGDRIDSLAELVEQMHNLSAGESVKFDVLRGVDRVEISVVPSFAIAEGAR